MKAKKYTKETILNIGIEGKNIPKFEVGDTVAVAQKIKEGDKERVQTFEGFVVSRRSKGISSTFTVRKIGADSVPVERIFPLYSPAIESIRFVKGGDVRRAKLYYMRDRVGRAALVKEKVLTQEDKARASKK